MSISGSGTSLLQSVLDTQSTRVESEVALLKKAQTLLKQQGHAMIDVLEQAGTCQGKDQGRLLDAYA